MQFVLWAAIFCVFNLAVMAVFVAELRKEVSNPGGTGRLFAAQIFPVAPPHSLPTPSRYQPLNLAYTAWVSLDLADGVLPNPRSLNQHLFKINQANTHYFLGTGAECPLDSDFGLVGFISTSCTPVDSSLVAPCSVYSLSE